MAYAPINFSGAGDHTLITGITDLVVQVTGIYLQCGIATSITLKSGSSTALTGPMTFTVGGSMNLLQSSVAYMQTNAGDGLIINIGSLLGQVAGFIQYNQILL